jgi:hypothetical protein
MTPQIILTQKWFGYINVRISYLLAYLPVCLSVYVCLPI